MPSLIPIIRWSIYILTSVFAVFYSDGAAMAVRFVSPRVEPRPFHN